MKAVTKILIVLAVLVVLLGIAAGVLYFLATTDDNAGKYEAEPSTDIVEPAVKDKKRRSPKIRSTAFSPIIFRKTA